MKKLLPALLLSFVLCFSMKDGDTTMQKDELEGLYDKKAKELAHLKAYGDGTGEFVFLDETSQITWEDPDGQGRGWRRLRSICIY